MSFHDCLGGRQAKPAPATHRPRPLAPEERLRHPRQILRGNAGSIVADPYQHRIGKSLDPHPWILAVPDGIGEKVRYIALDGDAAAGNDSLLVHPAFLDRRSSVGELIRHGADERCNREGLYGLASMPAPQIGEDVPGLGYRTRVVRLARLVLARGQTEMGVHMPGAAERFCQLSCQSCRRTPADTVSLSCLEESEHGCRTAEVKHATAVGGNMLVVAGARTEVVSESVVAATLLHGPAAWRWRPGELGGRSVSQQLGCQHAVQNQL
jgi:hypothetical protein